MIFNTWWNTTAAVQTLSQRHTKYNTHTHTVNLSVSADCLPTLRNRCRFCLLHCQQTGPKWRLTAEERNEATSRKKNTIFHHLIHASKLMFNNEIKSVQGNGFDILNSSKQLIKSHSLLFDCSLFSRRRRRCRRHSIWFQKAHLFSYEKREGV